MLKITISAPALLCSSSNIARVQAPGLLANVPSALRTDTGYQESIAMEVVAAASMTLSTAWCPAHVHLAMMCTSCATVGDSTCSAAPEGTLPRSVCVEVGCSGRYAMHCPCSSTVIYTTHACADENPLPRSLSAPEHETDATARIVSSLGHASSMQSHDTAAANEDGGGVASRGMSFASQLQLARSFTSQGGRSAKSGASATSYRSGTSRGRSFTGTPCRISNRQFFDRLAGDKWGAT